jgi:meiotic recombination protein REC8
MSLRYMAEDDGSDDEYGKPRRKPKQKDKRRLPPNEVGRATMHTLDESLEQMMSGSFEVSFLGGADGEQQHFSPQIDAGFDFGDSEGFGFVDIGDELAKELGEGWASAPVQSLLSLLPVAEGTFTLPNQAFRGNRTAITHLF